MPVINVALGMGQVSEGQKKQLISRLASDAAEIIGMPVEHFVTFINEAPLENIGVGARTVKEIKAGR